MHYRTFVSGFLIGVVVVMTASPARAQDAAADEAGDAKGSPTKRATTASDGSILLDPTIVSATPVPQPQSTLGTNATVVDAAEIEARGITDLRDAVKISPGVHLEENGGRGSLSQVRLRGGEADHTLVLIDGMPANQVGGVFNFGPETLDNVERVEVVRGAVSALYGAEAMSGVVSIVTKKGEEGPPQWTYDVSGGGRDTVRAYGSVSGGTARAHYSGSVSGRRTGNLDGLQNDTYKHVAATTRMGTWLGDDVELDGSVRYDRYTLETPRDGVGLPGDRDDLTRTTRAVATGSVTHHLSDTWEHRLKVGVLDEELDHRDLVNDNLSGGFFSNDFAPTNGKIRSDRYTLDYRHSVTVLEDHILTVGGELEEEEGSRTDPINGGFGALNQRVRILDRAAYAQVQSSFLDEALNVQAGLRYDNNSFFGDETLLRAAGSYRFAPTDTRLHASYGEGIKVGTVAEMTSNPLLREEETDHWDVGIEQRLLDGRVVVDVTYFEQEVDNLIRFVFVPPITFAAFNVDEAETRGIEVSASAQILDDLVGRMHYTFLETEDLTTHDTLLRRPKHAAYGSLDYAPGPWRVGVAARYGGERRDLDFTTFPSPRVTLDEFVDLSFTGGYDINEHVEVYARVSNALDDHYETVFNYPSNGVNVIVGARGTF